MTAASMVNLKNLARPEHFDGSDEKWLDWKYQRVLLAVSEGTHGQSVNFRRILVTDWIKVVSPLIRVVVVETATQTKTGFLKSQWLEETATEAPNEGTQLGKQKAGI
eukprot:9102663-Heterocapsa_arctica.AAC.1